MSTDQRNVDRPPKVYFQFQFFFLRVFIFQAAMHVHEWIDARWTFKKNTLLLQPARQTSHTYSTPLSSDPRAHLKRRERVRDRNITTGGRVRTLYSACAAVVHARGASAVCVRVCVCACGVLCIETQKEGGKDGGG